MTINILADASLPDLHEVFPSPFKLTLYHKASEIKIFLPDHEILLCRSTLLVNQDLISGCNSLKVVATASSGTDHIDANLLANKGIKLLDAKGSNAQAVADYVLSSLAYLKTTNNFNGSKVGIIGAGAVGMAVATCLQSIGLNVIFYDPLKALIEPDFHGVSMADLVDCELICVHANLHSNPPFPSINLINEDVIKRLRAKTVIINAARGGIVNEEDLLNFGKSLIYCTDVYASEPYIDPRIVQFATLCTPHIAGHSIEAKQRAVVWLSQKLHAFYHLTHSLPQEKMSQQSLTIIPEPGWESMVLSLYNPYQETIKLKNAVEPLDKVFQSVRIAHNYRHELGLGYQTITKLGFG